MTHETERAKREVDAHERCATSARSPEKKAEHLLAAFLLRQQFGIPEPIRCTFGRDETMYRVQAFRRAELLKEQEFKNK